MPENEVLTNSEVLTLCDLPETIVETLQTAQGSEFAAAANEFLSALFNKIIYQRVHRMEFKNPFAKYEGFPIEYGVGIENVWVEPAKGYKFNPDATNPFAKKKPSVKSLYAILNYDLQYKTTVEDALLRKACVSQYGFASLIESIIGSLYQGMKLDEYFAQLVVFNNEDIYAGGFTEITREADDASTAKKLAEVIVDTASHMELPTKTDNATGVMNNADKSSLMLVIKYDLLNKINLDFLSGVFNLKKVDMITNIVPVESFQCEMTDANGDIITDESDNPIVAGEDIDFIIVDTDGIDNHKALQDGGMIYNPEGKYTNHYYNNWGIRSYKTWFNAKAFKLVDAEVTPGQGDTEVTPSVGN